MSRILIAEDDRAIREAVSDALELAGFETRAVPDGAAALAAWRSGAFDLLLLDVMMPHLDGFELCRRIRRDDPKTPIILLTAKSEEVDKVLGLGFGADDYVTKPFGIRELVARIHAALRRAAAEAPASQEAAEESETFRFAGWEIRPAERQARRGGENVDLSVRECDLLRFFAAHPRIVLDRDRIMREVWHTGPVASRTLDQHLVALRRKLDAGRVIVSVYGAGYRYLPPEEDA